VRLSNRVLPDEIKKLVRKEVRSDKELDQEYDIVFITDETKTHFQNILKYRPLCKHMFIEKPIFEYPRYSLAEICSKDKDGIYYVAAPMRFSRYYQQLQKCVQETKVYSARIEFSSYMPDWQKGRDYRKSFRCFNERGGGVDIDLLHEIDYMVGLFGQPNSVHRVAGKYSHLEMDACDLATYLFEYSDKVVEIHLDYFGRKRTRKVELFAKQDTIVVDFNATTCEYQGEEKLFSYGTECDFYVEEMNYFLDLIASEGKITNINPPELAYTSLKLAKGII
jgi:predicted dehydrogenase